MYGENADIEDEFLNDKFGEIAESNEFINRIADNKNLLERLIEKNKNVVKYVTSSK